VIGGDSKLIVVEPEEAEKVLALAADVGSRPYGMEGGPRTRRGDVDEV